MFIENYGKRLTLVVVKNSPETGRGHGEQEFTHSGTLEELIEIVKETALSNIDLRHSYEYRVRYWHNSVPIDDFSIVERPYDRNALSFEYALKCIKVKTLSIVEPNKVGPKMRALYSNALSGSIYFKLPHYDHEGWEEFNDRRNLSKNRRGFFQKIKEIFTG